jgi:hypothetical protein
VIADKWGYVVWLIPVALVAAVAAGRWQTATFAVTWLVLAAGGLLLTYWVSTLPLDSNLTNTSYRTIVPLLIGGASTVPLLVFPLRARPAEESVGDGSSGKVGL